MQCICCSKSGTTKEYPVCLNCVCCEPDCENIGLFHSYCFYHSEKKQIQKCDTNCWRCKQDASNGSNYQEYVYIYETCIKRVFLTCQQTRTIANQLKSNMDIRASSPKFNIKNGIINGAKHYDLPIYGVDIPQSIFDMFQMSYFDEIRRSYNFKSLQYGINGFLQQKSKFIAKYFEANEKITTFLKRFQQLDVNSIKSMKDWDAFLNTNDIPSNWKLKVHKSQVLSLFDEVNHNHNPNAIQWLSKIVCAYNVDGCLTDAVNLVFCLNTFSWIPDILIIDCETDDLLCVIMLTFLNPNIKIIAQLPTDQIFDKLAKEYESFNWQIIRDPASKNAEALKFLNKL